MSETRSVRMDLKTFSVKSVLSIFLLLLVFCDSVSVDNLIQKKCSVHDSECQKSLYKNVMRAISKGSPEIDLPPYDPLQIKNMSVSILESVKITMIEGVAKGAKKCIFNHVSTDMDKRVFNMDLTCDMSIAGTYKVIAADIPFIESIFRTRSLNATGFTKIDLEKVHIVSEYDFFLRKGDDGEIYFDYKREGIRYTYDVGKVKFYIDNMVIQGQDYSELVMSLVNDNWKFLMGSFGKIFMDRVMDIFYTFTHKFWDAVPAKATIIEDMSPYL